MAAAHSGCDRYVRYAPTGRLSPSLSGLRRENVLVVPEQVRGVVGLLDLGESVVVALVVGADPALVVVGHEVDVATLLRVRCRGLVVVMDPGRVALVVLRVWPHA